jgi:hypothetical protein
MSCETLQNGSNYHTTLLTHDRNYNWAGNHELCLPYLNVHAAAYLKGNSAHFEL